MPTIDLTPYADTDYQVWVVLPTGASYTYRDGLMYLVALNWAKSWNEHKPVDVPEGAQFVAVRATTNYEVIA